MRLGFSNLNQKSRTRKFCIFEAVLTACGILITATASFMVSKELLHIALEMLAAERWVQFSIHIIFCVVVFFLVYGGLVYQATRLAYYVRRARHQHARTPVLEAFRERDDLPVLTILVPSYKEEERVVEQTLLSAALQDYPKRRVVLLIDNPPHPTTESDKAELRRTRELPEKIQSRLAIPRNEIENRYQQFLSLDPNQDLTAELAKLRDTFEWAANWFANRIDSWDCNQHDAAVYASKFLWTYRRKFLRESSRVYSTTDFNSPAETREYLKRRYERLISTFTVEISSFERKQFENCSHEPNKAMNLNSYIALVGKSFRITHQPDGKQLLNACAPADADLSVPDTDFFITLDADSIIVPDYAARLAYHLLLPGNEKIAVIQTPYSAFPNAPGHLERLAGATTDIQYLIHQGFTAFGATYWVGANALLRKSALNDIAVTELERGHEVTRYIQDRTVIEDTESSIDLVEQGWQLFNYPQRMAYSATPPDFGSLIIQRRRWANGGLIILPKLVRYLFRRCLSLKAYFEGFMRIHYLVSIAAVNFGLLLVLAFPFTENIRTWWLPITALPYFFFYTRDLTIFGYNKRDMLGVYALNLLLIPVNLGGVCKSLQQMCTREKIPFVRTPKISGRTAAGPMYIASVYFLIALWIICAAVDVVHGRIFHSVFALGNASFLIYALITMIGVRESYEDLSFGIREATRSSQLLNSRLIRSLKQRIARMQA